jgi:hypothetical protein
MNAAVGWTSKAWRVLTLSCSEAQYVALIETVKEIKLYTTY